MPHFYIPEPIEIEIDLDAMKGLPHIDKRPRVFYPDWTSTHDHPLYADRPTWEVPPVDASGRKLHVRQPPLPQKSVPIPRPVPIVNPKPTRPARPPTEDFSQFESNGFEVPDFPPELMAKMAALEEESARRKNLDMGARAAKTAALLRTQTKPLNIRRKDRDASHPAAPPATTTPFYSNQAASQSTRTIASQRSHALRDNANLQKTIYSNPTAGQSVYNVGANTQGHSSVAYDPGEDLCMNSTPDGASIRRRNASSATSRAVHDLRRHGIDRAKNGEEPIRVMRGPHAVKLQRVPDSQHALAIPINDTRSAKQWAEQGIRTGTSHSGAATIAGYGRPVHRR
ncbi:hypothetical protein H0H93_016465 [Arthromyces matolae]|nr:hypothetical protein H0H93_016465 [Arthromyces matolae]